jgi:hypothetical protein
MLSAVPSSGTVNTMIRITGIGDHDRLEGLIRINGIRTNPRNVPRRLDYILGARERSSKEVREAVLHDDGAAVPLTIPRQKGETDLAVKEVKLEGRRYIVCRNEKEARKDAETRATLLAGLQRKLAGGAKGLVGNTGYRRFLAALEGDGFPIDPAKVEADAQFDGVFVLRTSLAAMRCCALRRVRA